METQWHLPITCDGTRCGTASIERSGLYYEVSCVCKNMEERILRAYLDCGDAELCLGVLVPENGALCLRRKFPAARVLQPAFHAVRLRETVEGWAPWEGEIHDCRVRGALARNDGRETTVAMPFSVKQPFPNLPLFCLCTPAYIGGNCFLTIPLPEQE